MPERSSISRSFKKGMKDVKRKAKIKRMRKGGVFKEFVGTIRLPKFEMATPKSATRKITGLRKWERDGKEYWQLKPIYSPLMADPVLTKEARSKQ